MNENADLFRPLASSGAGIENSLFSKPSVSYWQDAVRRLKQNKLAMISLGFIIFITLLAIFGPLCSQYNYSSQNLYLANRPPSWEHWFGTDNLGRDLYIRVLYGARISLSIGMVASFLNFAIGAFYGGLAGYAGGRLDKAMMRLVDIFYGIPLLLYVILLMVILKPGLFNIFLALGLVYWLRMARLVRAQVLSLKEQEFVLAAKLIGAPPRRIIARHLIPNCMGPIIVTMTLSIPEAIFTEAFLSFIGLGVSAPMASWGVLASDGIISMRSYPFQLFFPALFISLTMLSFNFLGDGLRDALDPRMRR